MSKKVFGYSFIIASLAIIVVLIVGASEMFEMLVTLCFSVSETTESPESSGVISHLIVKGLLIVIAFILFKVGRRMVGGFKKAA